MAMSYCRLVKCRLDLKYVNRYYCGMPNAKHSENNNFGEDVKNFKPQPKQEELAKKTEPKLPVDHTVYQLPQAQPRTERYTTMELFTTDYNLAINTIKILNAVQFTPYGLKKAWSEFKEYHLLKDQEFLKERAEFLGPELATAHFVCFRGGKVRFRGQEEWIFKEPTSLELENVPNTFVESFKVEAVDCSNMKLVYEGLENMKSMENLKWLSLEGCQHIDDWCLDRIAGEYGHSLEHLNVRNCPLVTEKGIAVLSKIKRLKTLHLGGHPKARNLELVCLMLEDVLPDLKITGILYCDESFLSLENPPQSQQNPVDKID